VRPSAWPRWVHWLPAITWAATIFVLSSVSTLPAPPGPLSDKHAHALAFGALTLACVHGLVAGRWRAVHGRTVAIAVTMAVLYGISDELHQAFVPGRTADVADVAADLTGAVLAGALAWACAILLRRRRPARTGRGMADRGRPGRR
jgi:VanZ family protein